MNIYFSHGKLGSPTSVKMTRLSQIARSQGFNDVRLDNTDTLDPSVRTDRLREYLDKESKPFLLVGSSMGGYASMICATEYELCTGVFLLAPALFMSHYPRYDYSPKTNNIVIVHGRQDEVVPAADSEQFAIEKQYSLHLVDDGHRLHDTLEQISEWFEHYLNKLNHA